MTPRHQPLDRPRLSHDAEIGAAHATSGKQLAHDPLGGIDRDREADALGRANDRGVDADDARPRVDQGAAGVSRVQGHVALNDVLDQLPGGASERPADGAHHPRRHGRLKPERVTDGDDQLSDSQRARLAEPGGRKPGAVGTNHGEIRGRVAPGERRPERGAVGQRDLQIRRRVHHVTVRDDVPVRREDHAGARADRAGRPAGPPTAGGDADDRRANPLRDRDDRP